MEVVRSSRTSVEFYWAICALYFIVQGVSEIQRETLLCVDLCVEKREKDSLRGSELVK
jgi:hypothetical protein